MPATVGLNATTVTHRGSNTDAVIDISSTTNINMTGIWVFQIDQAQISGILYLSAANTHCQWNWLPW